MDDETFGARIEELEKRVQELIFLSVVQEKGITEVKLAMNTALETILKSKEKRT